MPGQITKLSLNGLCIGQRCRIGTHEIDLRRRCSASTGSARLILLESCALQRQSRQTLQLRTGRHLALRHQRVKACEVIGRLRAQLRLQGDVDIGQGGQLLLGVFANQDGQHLVGDARHRLQITARRERRTDIHHDQHIDAHRACHIDRQIAGDTPIGQQPAFMLHRCKQARRRQAGTDRRGQITLVQHRQLTGFQVRSHSTKARGQMIKVGRSGHRQGQLTQQPRQLLTLQQATRQHEHAIAQTQRQLHQILLLFDLAAQAQVATQRTITKGLLPVHTSDNRLDLRRAHTAGVQATDHGAHAGAGDGVYRHLQLLEHFEHADMGGTTRATPRQHQAHAGACRLLPCHRTRRRRVCGLGLRLSDRQQEQQRQDSRQKW